MAAISPITDVLASTTATQPAGIAAAELYAGDNPYALSTSSALALQVALSAPLGLGFTVDTTDAVAAVPAVVGTHIDRIA